MPHPKGTNEETLLERRARVWRLRTEEGKTLAGIGEVVGVSHTTIIRDLNWWTKRILDQMDDVIKRERALQISQLHTVVSASLRAWIESKKPQKELTERKVRMPIVAGEDANGNPIYVMNEQGQIEHMDGATRIRTKISQTTGNSAHLNTMLKAMADLRILLGLNAPRQIELLWQKELEEAGLDPVETFEKLVQMSYTELFEDSELEHET